MPIKSGFYKGRLGIGLDTTDNAYTSGTDTGVPLYPLDINGDIRITGCIVNKNGDAINLSTTIMALMQTDTNLTKIDSTVDFNILSTGHLKLPSGTTAQRTSPGVLGMLRYNTSLNQFEGYGNGNVWSSLGGVMDVDKDTYITAEQSTDEDKLRFYTGGNEKMLIQNTADDGIIIKSSIVPDTDSTFDIGSASKKIRHMYISTSSLWIGDEHRISIDNDGTMKFKKRNKNIVPKGLRDALGLDSTASVTKVKADLGITDISTLKLGDWISYARTHATGLSNADIKDIFKNEDNEDYEQIDGTVTTVGELNQITNVNTDTKAQGQPLVWNGGTWSASSDIYIYNGKVGIGTTSPNNTLQVVSTIGEMVEFKNTSGYSRLVLNGAASNGCDLIFRQNGTSKWGIANIGDDLHFMGDDNTSQQYMTIKDNGNVGIGTTNPLAKLNVVGNVVFGTYGPSNIITHTDAQLTLHGTHNAEYNTNNKIKLLFAGADNDGGAPYDMMSEDENGVETFWLKGPTSQGGTDGVLYMKGQVGIGVTAPTEKLDVTGNIKASGNVTAHTVSAQNYAVGGTNFISASRQGNFRDLEVKDNANNATILLSGGTSGVSGGDISITGTLSTDTISEKTSGTGVTIDSVLLKDQNVTAHTVTAQNYAVGGTNFISASRQGNFRDLEVKDSNNTATILLTGDGGTVSATKFIGDGSELTGVATSGGGSGFNWTAQDGTKNISDTNMHHGYKVSASSNSGADANQYSVDNAFRSSSPNPNWEDVWRTISTSYNTTTGAYTGSVTTAGVTGEWLQIDFGRKAKVYHYGILPMGEQDYQTWTAPRTFVLFGSNDGSTWTNLGSSSATFAEYHGDYQNQNYDDGNYPKAGCKMKETTLSAPATYQYFRLVITANFGNHTQYSEFSAGASDGRLRIGYLAFYGAFPEQVDKVAVVSGTNMVHVSDSTYFSTTITAKTIMNYEYQAMRLVITPSATDSVIEIKYSIFAEIDHNNNFRITRNINGTDVLVVPTTEWDEGIIAVPNYDEDYTHTPQNINFTHYDEPNTTSTVTYKVWVGSTHTSNKTIYFNGGNSSTGGDFHELGVSKGSAIEHPKPQQSLTTVTNASQVEGQVLETLAGVCDGRTVTVSSGTYTLPNVTTSLSLTSTYATVTGSEISYTPPPNTKQVIYIFKTMFSRDSSEVSAGHITTSCRLYIDNVEQTGFRRTYGASYFEGHFGACWTIDIGSVSSTDNVNSRFPNWTTPKTIKIEAREWDNNANAKLHSTEFWDGTSDDVFSAPQLEIQAIGTADYDVVQRVVTYKDGQVLETLAGLCDGRTITVSSGTYTFPTTTSTGQFFDNGVTNVAVEGSNISYKPPSGTKQVIFKFFCNIAGYEYNNYTNSNSFIASFQGYLDDTALNFKFTESHHGGSTDTTCAIEMIFEIGGVDDIANGKLTSWDTLKTISLKGSCWNHDPRSFTLHVLGIFGTTDYHANANPPHVPPRIEITAIGRQVAPASAADFKIQKVDTISTLPNNGNMLTWDAAKGRWKPSEFIVENNDGTKNISDLNLYHGYQVSTSSVVDDQTTAEDAFRKTEAYMSSSVKKGAWESAYNTYSTSGDYTGSQTTNGYVGEWVQINFNKKVKVYHYHITPIAPSSSTYDRYKRAPKEYKVFGSNDGTTWIEVHSGTATTTDYTGSETPTDYQKNRQFVKTNTLSTPAIYQYFRLVINKTLGDIAPSTQASLSYLAFYGNFPNERIQTLPVSGVNMVHISSETYKLYTAPTNVPGVNISEFNMVITPTASDSVIELKYNVGGENEENTCFRITRNIDGTDVLLVPATNVWEGAIAVPNFDNNDGATPHITQIRWYDEPNTTSPVTYKLWWSSADPSYAGYRLALNGNIVNTYETNKEKPVSSAAIIEHPKPQSVMSSVNNSTAVEGQVLETLSGKCKGQSITVSSGTYTLENPTAEFSLTDGTTWKDLTGSKINYKPPTGTKQVIYEFSYHHSGDGGSADLHIYRLSIDGTSITNEKGTFRTGGGSLYENFSTVRFVIDINGIDDLENNSVSSWNTLKELKMEVSGYSTSYVVNIHRVTHFEGSNGSYNGFHGPTLKITAIGTAQYDVVQRVVNYKDGQLLETLAGVCDGRSITSSSGTYTLENITQGTLLNAASANFIDFPGSSINYKPPTGVKQVSYTFHFTYGRYDLSSSMALKFFIDDTEVTVFKKYHGISADFGSSFHSVHFVIDVGSVASDDISNGKLANWNTSKTLKLQVTNQSNSYDVWINKSKFELQQGSDSSNGNDSDANTYVHKPVLKIQAYGRAIAPVGNFKIQDVDTITTPPTDGQALVWDDTNKHWKAGAGGGGGGGIQTLSAQPTIANSTAGALYYDTSWKTFFGRMESKWMEMMLEGTPLLFGHPSKIIPKNGANIVETTATTIEFTWVNPPQYRSCMSAKNTADYVDAINATNHTSGELYLPAINDIWFQYGSNTYKVGGKNITGASGNTAQSLSNISGPKKLTNKVVIITTGSSVPSYASSWTPSTSTSGEHYIGLDDNGNQTFIFNPNNTTWSLTASTNYNFKVWLENSTPNQLPPQVSHDSTSTADGTSNLVDSRNFSNHDGISTLEILPPTQIYVADNKLTNGFHVTLTRDGNTHYLTCIVPPEALTGTYNGTDDVKVTTTGDINAMDSVVYYKGFEVQYQTAVASDNFDKATSAIVWTGNWTNVVFSSSSTTNQTGTTFSTDADATNRIASFTPLKPTSTIVASGAGTTPTKNDFTVKKSFTLVQNDNKFYKFRVRAFNQVQTSINDSVWSEKEYVIRFNKPQTVTWKGTAAPHLPMFTTKTTEKLHWYITLNWNQLNIKSSVASGNDGTIDEYAHSDLKIHEYKLQRSQDGDTTWETVAYWILPDDNAQMETYDYRIHPPHDDRGETETSNDGNNTKTQEARLLAGTRAPQYSFKLQARNWLFGTGIDTGSIPGPRTNYQWARASATDNRWSAESVSSKTTYSTALIPVAPPKPVIHDNVDDKYAIKFYEMNTTDTKSPWKDGRIASHTDFNAIVDSSLVAARTKEATLQNETPDQDYISYQWKLPYPSEAFKDTLGSSVDRYEIVLETATQASTVIALENAKQSTEVKNWGWPTGTWNYYWSGTRDLSLSGVFEQKNSGTANTDKIYWLVKNPLPNGITRVWITLIYSGSYSSWGPGIGLNYRPYNGVGTPTGELHPNTFSQNTWSSPSVDLLPGTEIAVGGGGGIQWGLRVHTYSPSSYTPYHTQEIYANDFNYGAANWYLQEYTTNTLLDQSLNYKVKGYNFFVTNPSDYSDPLGTALTSDKPSAPQFLSTASDANKDNSNPTFTLTNDGLTLLVDEPQYTSVDANGNANNFQLESLTIQEFQIQPNIDNSDVDKYLVQDHANTKRMLSGSNPLLSQGKDVVASFFHPVTGTTALDEMTGGVVKYKVKAKNVLNSTFSDEAEATLTIGKPNPGINFKYSPKFTWVQSTNKIKLEFFRKYSSTDILFDGSSSTNAPISAVTANCNVTNEIKKLKWNVFSTGATGGTITTSYADIGDTTGYIDSGDNSTTVAAYTISDTGIENWAKGTDHHVRYRVKNQYHADWFEDPAASLYCQIKLTAPNAIPSSDISSQIVYGLENTPNKLNILWSKPTEYGLHYKHQGSSSIVAQPNQPNIKTYKVYFNDGTLYYIFSRTATNQEDVSDDATLVSGTTTVEKWTDSSRTAGYESSYTMSVVAGKTYVVEKITAINWLYNTESSFNTPPATTYLNGDSSAPPSQPKVEVESEISSGTTTVPLTNASDLGFEVGQTVEFDNGTNQEQKTITNIASITLNSALTYSYPLGSTIEVIPSSHGGQILSTTAPIPTIFSNYPNQGILISGSTTATVKKLGATNNGTALTDVLLNAAAPADTTSTMGIKITISGGVTGESTECKFDSTGIVSGNNLTLTYSGINLATITVGTYSDLYSGKTSSADNSGYWFINSSIQLKWHADASNINAFYGKNLTFSVVVTYYGTSSSVLTRQIETGYYDQTITNPSVTTITPAYTPYTCCGLPILHSTDTLTIATVFDNKSSTWVASSAVNTITLGGSVASVTTSKSNHTYSSNTVSLAATDMGSYSGSSLIKDAQITVVAKNCNGTGSLTHSSKYIYDPKTLDLITTIAGQSLTTDHISVASGGETGNASAGVVKMNVLNVPDNFHPTDSVSFTPALLDVTTATVNGKNRLIIYNGKFCSAAYFNQQFGTAYTGYHADVATIGGTQTTTASAGGTFYGAGGAVTTTLEDDFRWQIFGMRYKNTSGGGVPITTCEISLGSSSETNITENHLKKYTTDGSNYTYTADSTSDVEFWVKVKIAAGDGLDAYESRWNKLIQNNTNYIGASHGSINNKYNETNSSADRTSSWVAGTLSGSNNNIKLAIRQGSTAFTTPWDIFIAVGMRNNSNVKTFIEVPKTIGKLTSGS